MVPYGIRDTDMIDHHQNKRVDAQYNAWWSCLIPAEVIAAVGLPLPMFFTWDDIEYSVRAGAAGFPTISLPNAGAARGISLEGSLMHQGLLRYPQRDHHLRPSLRHQCREDGLVVPGTPSTLCLDAIRAGLHDDARNEDYLAGPSILRDGGLTALAAIRAERAQHPEMVIHRATDIAKLTGCFPRSRRRLANTWSRIGCGGSHNRLIRQWFGRRPCGPVAIARSPPGGRGP